jgi:hypothetical protein
MSPSAFAEIPNIQFPELSIGKANCEKGTSMVMPLNAILRDDFDESVWHGNEAVPLPGTEGVGPKKSKIA